MRIPQGFKAPISGFQRGTTPEKSVQFPSVTVGKGLAPSGGEMLQIYTVFRQIRKMLRVCIGIPRYRKCLLPEGAEPLPYG